MAMTRRQSPFGRIGRRSVAARAGAVAGAAVLGVSMSLSMAACGGGGSKPSSSATTGTTATTTATTPTSTPTETTTATSSPTATSTANGPADPVAATALVKKNWELFFDPKTPVADKEKYLQNGTVLAPLLQGFAADPRVAQVSSTVSNVAFTSPTTATVTYALSLQGTVVEPNATGQAVLQDGTWKVSDSTLCGLVALTGNTKLPGCS